MSIESDIHQTKPFRNEYHKAIINVQFTHSWVVEHVRDILKSHDLTPQQYNILRIVKGATEPISILDIRNRMLDKMSDASRIVERLIEKGLVNKIISKADKRRIEVHITQKGYETLRDSENLNQQFDKVFSNLTVTEAYQLNQLLDKFRASL